MHRACLEPASRVALVGLGGVGKSQLAIEHVYRMQDRFKREKKEVWAFWIHASTHARVEEGFKSIADAVRIRGRDQAGANLIPLVSQWLKDEQHGQWIMILDSADDINVFYEGDEKGKQIASTAQEEKPLWTYLPQSSNGSILITTRNKELAGKLTGRPKTDVIEVGPMDKDHALELLATKSGSQYDREDGMELVKALEYVPLAISQAAAFIQQREPRTSVKKYLDDFRESDENKSSLLNHDAGDLRRDESATNSVITTWQISFDYIRKKRRSATDLLSLLSFFDGQGISDDLVRPIDQGKSHNHEANAPNNSIVSSENLNEMFEKDIATLRNYCLISTNEAGDVFKMHALVQLSTRKWLDMDQQTEKFKKLFIYRMAQEFPEPEFSNWGTCRQLFPHAEKAIQKAIDYRPADDDSLIKWSLLLSNSGWYSRAQGNYTIAEKMAKESFETHKVVLGPEYPDTLSSMNNLASTYSNQGRWKEAESLGVQVLETRKAVLGPEHPNTLSSMANLASTYSNQGRWKEAESLGVQVLETRKAVLGPEHPNTLLSINNLASTYWNQGRWKEAESLGVQVLETRKAVLGPEHPSTLISMANLAATINNLASTYWNQERWKEAELLGVQVLETSKAVLGPEHPDTLTSMNNLAHTWKSQGRDQDALELMEKCYHARIRVSGPEHPHTQLSLSAIQKWRTGEPQTQKRRPESSAENVKTSRRAKFATSGLHQDSEAS
ncbi:P-loop containing nucleoside triphosphate hydrolase protein [Nemania diffusa]|nr:P-loop containing nucleoside triphosphate hydrolase protein [Nemania diffusa]